MYRIVGCILVVAAGAGMGFSGSMRLSEQIRILEKLLQMVICLKGEIRCGMHHCRMLFMEQQEE